MRNALVRSKTLKTEYVVAIFAGLLIGGCGAAEAHPESPAASAGRALIAPRCEALRAPPSNAAPVALFVQVARVTSPLGAPLNESLSVPVDVSQVAGLLVEGSAATRGPWGGDGEEGSLSVRILNAPSDANATAELALAYDGSADAATVTAGNQVPVIAPSAQGGAPGSVVVTPYYLFGNKDEGLRTLQQCFAAQKGQ